MSWIQQIDFMILEWIQSHLQGAALDLLMPTITALGNGGWLFILLALVLLLSKRYRRQGCALAVSLLLCLLVGNLFLKPLFARLRPVCYRLKDGTSGRVHTGLIAQDVEQALAACGLTGQDFAAFVRSPREGGGADYGLRYEEFVALCIRQIQRLQARVERLEG